jgi:hypothetical protein
MPQATDSVDLWNSSQERVFFGTFLICTNLIYVSYAYRDNLHGLVHASLFSCSIDVTERATTVGLFIDANWMPCSKRKKKLYYEMWIGKVLKRTDRGLFQEMSRYSAGNTEERLLFLLPVYGSLSEDIQLTVTINGMQQIHPVIYLLF